MAKHGKAYLDSRQRLDRAREYEPAEAIALLKELRGAKFNESVEVHVRTGLNVRHADEQLRGTIALPNGLGKEVKIAVFAQGDKAREAEEAGADVVGAEDLATRIQEGFDDFDVAIATPDLMPVVGRLGRILGPRARCLTPRSARSRWTSPRRSRVEGRQGRVPHRPHRDRPPGDRQARLRRAVLLENYAAVIEELIRAKPSAAKGRYIRSSPSRRRWARASSRPVRTRDIAEGARRGLEFSAHESRPRSPAARAVSPGRRASSLGRSRRVRYSAGS